MIKRKLASKQVITMINKRNIKKKTKDVKVLICTPIDDRKMKCFDKYFNGVLSTGLDILILDTTGSRAVKGMFYDKVKDNSRVTYYTTDWPERMMDKLVVARNLSLDYAKDNGYDYVLFVDADVIATKKAADTLIQSIKELKEEPYMLAGVYLQYHEDKLKIVHNIETTESYKIMPMDMLFTGLVPVAQAATGFTLVSTKVPVRFRCARDKNNKLIRTDDYCFSDDLYLKRISTPYANTNVLVSHILGDTWDENKA